jgi:sodium transport system permease protein
MGRVMLAVMRKEWRDATRDWRALASALLYAVWGPAVMALALAALARDRGPESPLILAIAGQERAAALTSFFSERSVTLVPAPPHPAARIRARELPVALAVAADYAANFEAARPGRVILTYDASWSDSNAQAARVRALLTEYARRVADTRLVLRGIGPASISPLRIDERDLSTAAGRAAMVLGMLPIFVLVSTFVGGMGVAADITAGERERSSLESLLINPVPRAAIVVGKWAAAAAIALTTVTLTIGASQILLQHPRIQTIDLPIGLSTADAARMWLLMAPLALLATAVQLLVGLFAATYKEAQTHMSVLLFAPMLPGFLFAFGSLDERPWMLWLPVLGQHVGTSNVLRGESTALGGDALLAAVTLVATAAVLTTSAFLLERESIVRRLGG